MAVDPGPQGGRSAEARASAAAAKYEEAYAELAASLGLASEPDKASKVMLRWLCEQEHYLLVVDGANQSDVARQMLPDARRMRGHVLITTREAIWSWHAAHLVDLDVWPADEAVQFLAKVLNTAVPAAELRELAGVLGCVPLALEQSAAYIDKAALREADLARYVARLTALAPSRRLHGRVTWRAATSRRCWQPSAIASRWCGRWRAASARSTSCGPSPSWTARGASRSAACWTPSSLTWILATRSHACAGCRWCA